MYKPTTRKRLARSYLSAFATLVLLCTLIFGNPLDPILAIIAGMVRVPFFIVATSILGGIITGVYLIHFMRKYQISSINSEPSILVVIVIISAILIASMVISVIRYDKIQKLQPDLSYTMPFVLSLNKAPKEFQFYLHGAALKDCVPYAWSYRKMDFYKLGNNVAVNVLPRLWINQCHITRT